MKYPKIRDWDPAFDMPHDREQALAVLKAWASPSTMTFSSERCARVLECLTYIAPRVLRPALSCSYGTGWSFGTKDGWFGSFATKEEALDAAYEEAA